MKIAFDIDDTILIPSVVTASGDNVPNYDVIAVLRFFQQQGHEIILWSGSGMDWAKRWGEKFGLEPFTVMQKEKRSTWSDNVEKHEVDICFDDCVVDLARVNVRVKRIRNSVSRKEWNETKGHEN